MAISTPKVALVGSTSFKDLFTVANKELSLRGFMVYSLACFPDNLEKGKAGYTPLERIKLTHMHLAKIEESDIVFVVGDGYIGRGTVYELLWAELRRKPVIWGHDWSDDWNECAQALRDCQFDLKAYSPAYIYLASFDTQPT